MSILLALVAGIFVWVNGKAGTFQIINGHHTPFLDTFFKYYTHAGDGIMWLVPLFYCIFFKRKYLLMIMAGIIISTILSQFLKRVIYPEELRPVTFLSENFPVHVVDGVRMNRVHSFPSGHTSAAFTMALLASFMINKKIWAIVLPVLALLVGYSRVYLAQHFATDVLAGILVGIVSAYLSVLIGKRLQKKEKSPQS